MCFYSVTILGDTSPQEKVDREIVTVLSTWKELSEMRLRNLCDEQSPSLTSTCAKDCHNTATWPSPSRDTRTLQADGINNCVLEF